MSLKTMIGIGFVACIMLIFAGGAAYFLIENKEKAETAGGSGVALGAVGAFLLVCLRAEMGDD